MRCPKCGSNELAVTNEAIVTAKLECTCCGRAIEVRKVPIGKKDTGVYFRIIDLILLQEKMLILEARGVDILHLLVIAGNYVKKSKIARNLGCSVDFAIDNKGQVVPTLKILLGM
jgi:hypothetical protein